MKEADREKIVNVQENISYLNSNLFFYHFREMNPENYDLLNVVLTREPSCDSDFIFTRGRLNTIKLLRYMYVIIRY